MKTKQIPIKLCTVVMELLSLSCVHPFLLGWHVVNKKKRELVRNANALGAEITGCGMVLDEQMVRQMSYVRGPSVFVVIRVSHACCIFGSRITRECTS